MRAGARTGGGPNGGFSSDSEILWPISLPVYHFYLKSGERASFLANTSLLLHFSNTSLLFALLEKKRETEESGWDTFFGTTNRANKNASVSERAFDVSIRAACSHTILCKGLILSFPADNLVERTERVTWGKLACHGLSDSKHAFDLIAISGPLSLRADIRESRRRQLLSLKRRLRIITVLVASFNGYELDIWRRW